MYILITIIIIIIIGGLGGLFYYFYKKTNELVAELIASLSEEQKNRLASTDVIFEGTNEWTQDAIIAKVIDKGNKVSLKLLWFNKTIQNNYYNKLEIAEMSISKKEFIDHNLAEGSFVKLHIAPEKTIGSTTIRYE